MSTMIIEIKYDNKRLDRTALKLTAQMYATVYFDRFCTWFDDKSGRVPRTEP